MKKEGADFFKKKKNL